MRWTTLIFLLLIALLLPQAGHTIPASNSGMTTQIYSATPMQTTLAVTFEGKLLQKRFANMILALGLWMATAHFWQLTGMEHP
jgi:hypothetical protein